MTRKQVTVSALALSVAILITGAAALTALGLIPKNDAVVFADTSAITLVQDRIDESGKEIGMSITNLTGVRSLVATIRLDKKDPCWCLHLHHATFETRTKQIEVSFCGHCFDVVESRGTRNYRMPKKFYGELQKQIKQQAKAGWLLPEP